MGSDNLFHRLRERKEASFERRIEWRTSNPVVLIVCQGKKTEPNYLLGLQAALRIESASLHILKAGQGRDSLSIVKAGIVEYEKDESAYDRVYCVFDKDGDSQYGNALNLAVTHSLAKRNVLFPVNSVPCFEIWLLLHFHYTTSAYVKTGNRSPCDNVLIDLKKKGRIPNYEKNHKGIYGIVGDKTHVALKNAKLLRKVQHGAQTDNPSTQMDHLVSYLQSIAPRSRRG